MKNRIVCFGEVLWDIYPEHRKLGGAPFNVAAHLTKLGRSVSLVSRVGVGKNGKEVRKEMERMQMDQSCLQSDKDLLTGFVKVALDEEKVPTFEIVYPVAFDRIELTEENTTLVEHAKALVYGTLAGRDEVSRNTLLALLRKSPFSVLDLNLRQSFYRFEWIEQMLAHTQILKVNEMELDWLASELNLEVYETIQYLLKNFPLTQVILTRGAAGASVFRKGKQHDVQGYKIDRVDTVGAGDAFLAGYLHHFFNRSTTKECLGYASRMGALIATKFGGIPEYDIAELEALK